MRIRLFLIPLLALTACNAQQAQSSSPAPAVTSVPLPDEEPLGEEAKEEAEAPAPAGSVVGEGAAPPPDADPATATCPDQTCEENCADASVAGLAACVRAYKAGCFDKPPPGDVDCDYERKPAEPAPVRKEAEKADDLQPAPPKAEPKAPRVRPEKYD